MKILAESGLSTNKIMFLNFDESNRKIRTTFFIFSQLFCALDQSLKKSSNYKNLIKSNCLLTLAICYNK